MNALGISSWLKWYKNYKKWLTDLKSTRDCQIFHGSQCIILASLFSESAADEVTFVGWQIHRGPEPHSAARPAAVHADAATAVYRRSDGLFLWRPHVETADPSWRWLLSSAPLRKSSHPYHVLVPKTWPETTVFRRKIINSARHFARFCGLQLNLTVNSSVNSQLK